MPLLHLSLRLIDFYSPSLRWFLQAVTGSDRPSYRPILLHLLHLIGFYSPSLRWFSQVPVSLNCSLSCLYCIGRFSLLVSTVLPSVGSQVQAGSDRPSYRPILLHLLHLIGFYSPSLRWFSQVPVSLNCSLSCLYCIGRFSLLISTVLPPLY